MLQIVRCVLVIIFCCLNVSVSYAAPQKQQVGGIHVVSLSGTYHEMGVQYGQLLQNELKQALAILKEFYVTEQGIAYDKVIKQANLLYARFPTDYQIFIQGVAEGAAIPLADAIVLNGMETLTGLHILSTIFYAHTGP